MRIRQIKPAFFKDARVSALPPAVRLFYIGLWMLADDAGYLRWDPTEAAMELYGYETRGKRERNATAYMSALVEAGRVVDFGCGHVRVPTLTDHQRFAGPTKRVLTYEREHLSCPPPPIPAPPRDGSHSPDPLRIRGTRNGTEQEPVRNGSELVAPAGDLMSQRDDEDAAEMARLRSRRSA